MSTFTDLPRYPKDSVDEAEASSELDGALRGAATIVQTAAELLAFASPIFACLWFVMALPILLALILMTATRDERR